MTSISPRDGFNYKSKSDVVLPALKGGGIIAGGLLLFNFLLDKPGIGTALVGYRRTMHRFFRFLGGKNFTDRQLMDAGAMSFVDGITFSGVALVGGRLGLLGNGKEPTRIDELKDQGPER